MSPAIACVVIAFCAGAVFGAALALYRFRWAIVTGSAAQGPLGQAHKSAASNKPPQA